MNNVIEKLSSYQLLTNLIPGMLFGFTAEHLLKITLIPEDIMSSLIAFYFMGLLISRIGSLIIEPILRKIKFLSYTEYSDFIKASKLDAKLELLVETNNFYRSLFTCFLLIPVTKLYILLITSWGWLCNFWYWPIVISGLVLFMFSFRKQSDYICKRVKATIGDQSTTTTSK